MLLSAPLRVCVFILLVCTAALMLVSGGAGAQSNRVTILPVQGIIGPATSDYVINGLSEAASDSTLVIIELDTPGGLDPSMRAIVQAILASPVPVATFVSPGGARAASAGTFILYASHIAAMAPASNLGAASPVSVGMGGARDPDAGTARGRSKTNPDNASPQIQQQSEATEESAEEADRQSQGNDTARPADDDIMAGKVKSDAAAYIRSLAQLRERNVEFAEQAVLDAASLSAHEALEQEVIDYIARDVNDLLSQIDGHEVTLANASTVHLDTTAATIEYREPGWRTKILSVITNPQLALVLMMIGIYGLFFELTSPGFALPGVAGVICLLLALYSFHLLPVNWAGVSLVLVGACLMVAEVFFPSFGALGIGGVIAFVLGGFFLIDTDIPAFDVSLPFLLGLAVASALLLMMAGTFVARAHKQRVVTGSDAMVGLQGVITQADSQYFYAHIRGEQWRVRADEPLALGDRVTVTAVQGLTLQVVRLAPPDANVF